MANWCNNNVAFFGTEEAIAKLKTHFGEMLNKQEREQQGQLPDFITEKQGYFFDMYWNEDGEPILHYETKWTPNIGALVKVAQHCNVDFECAYEELGNCIYGEAQYHDGILKDVSLDFEDFEQYSYLEQTSKWTFEGKEYESDFEILETLLERKQQLQQQLTQPKMQ